MTTKLNLKMISVMAIVEDWNQFASLAQSEGLSTSGKFRQVIRRELQRAAKEAASDAKAARRK